MQDGENYSRGFEADITANPVQGLNMVAGYSYNNSKVTKTDAADYLGRSNPKLAGPLCVVGIATLLIEAISDDVFVNRL